MPKHQRRSDRAAFAMTDETTNTHRPKRTHPHLVTEVLEKPNRAAGEVYGLTYRLTPFACHCLGVPTPEARTANQL